MKKVVFVPGISFFTSGQGDDFIRLNFTFALFEDIDEGIKKLCLAMKDLIYTKDNQEVFADIKKMLLLFQVVHFFLMAGMKTLLELTSQICLRREL